MTSELLNLLFWIAGLMFWSGYALGIGIENSKKPVHFSRVIHDSIGGLAGSVGGIFGSLFSD